MDRRSVNAESESPSSDWRRRLHAVVFDAETPQGKAFDIAVITLILASVAVVILESVREFREAFGEYLVIAEWCFTVLFTIEYILRLISVKRPLRFVISFYGLIDLFAVVPTYLNLLVPGTQYLLTIRILRLLRIFRILKLSAYFAEARIISDALRASRR